MAASSQVPPPTIDWSSANFAKSMDRFIRQVRLHFEGPMRNVDDDAKLRYLLLWAGVEGQEISDTFVFRHEEERTVETYIKYFRQYANPRSNFRVARHELLQCRQNSDESAHSFLKRLRQIAKQCEYDQLVEDTLIVDLFIFGIYLKSAQKSLIKEGNDLTIAKALRIVETEEVTCKQVEAIRIPVEESSTHAIQAKNNKKPTQCGYCGKGHPRGECPAKGKSCMRCNKKGHFANVCRSKTGGKKHASKSDAVTVAQRQENPHGDTK